MKREEKFEIALEEIQAFCANYQINELQQKDQVLYHIWEMCYEALAEDK